MATLGVPPDISFVILAVITIVAAVIALEAKELIYGAVALALSFIGIAGFFVFLDAPYLAMLQIAIYVGAIVVLILFSIMLVRRDHGQDVEQPDSGETSPGLWLAGLLALSIAGVIALAGPNLPSEPPVANLPVSDLSRSLVLQYPVPLVILALLISAALIGSLILVKVER